MHECGHALALRGLLHYLLNLVSCLEININKELQPGGGIGPDEQH